MRVKKKERPSSIKENSVHKAVLFLIEECMRNGDAEKAHILRSALVSMEASYTSLSDEDFKTCLNFLSKVVETDKKTIDHVVKVIDFFENDSLLLHNKLLQ